MISSSGKIRAKFDELVVYVCSGCDMLPSWGRTKLAKLLYFSDFRHYRKHGVSITGIDYTCRPQGPVPSTFYDSLRHLVSTGAVVELEREIGDYQEKRPTAVRSADLSTFSAEEISTVDWVIREYGRLNAVQLSELSHKEPGWRLARPGESIPIETALLSSDRLTSEELDFVRKQVAG